jgi:hypothetical protein
MMPDVTSPPERTTTSIVVTVASDGSRSASSTMSDAITPTRYAVDALRSVAEAERCEHRPAIGRSWCYHDQGWCYDGRGDECICCLVRML